MKPAPFAYHRAHSVAEAVALLAELGDEAKILAGGLSLVPMMNFRLARPTALVDVSRIDGLSYLRAGPGEAGPAGLRIGALTTHRTVEISRDPVVLTGFSVLPRSARWIGHYPIRSRGTFGGSIAHADPASEWCLLAVLLPVEVNADPLTGQSATAATWQAMGQHALVNKIDGTAARRAPGVERLFTAESLGHPYLLATLEREEFVPTAMPILAGDKVRFVGEPVAMVIADDAYRAEDAAELVEVYWDPRPAVASMETATAAGAPRLHDHGNCLVDLLMFDDDRLPRIFAEAKTTVSATFSSARVAALPLEGRACLAEWDDRDDQLVMHVSTQVPHQVRSGVAQALGLAERSVRVIAPDVGGGFGLKCVVGREEVAVAAAALRLRRPVRWTEDRQENLTAAFHGHEQNYRVKAAFDAEGRILGLDAEIDCDTGAYSAFPFTCAVEPLMAATELPGVYKVPAYRARGRAIATNKAPAAPYRGVSRPQIVLVMERLMEKAAAALELGPLQVRRANLIGKDEFPYTGVNKITYDEGSYLQSLDLAEQIVTYKAWGAERDRLRTAGQRAGIGYACFSERTAYGTPTMSQRRMRMTPGYDTALVRMDPTGEVIVTTGTCGHGQGHETTFAQITADALGVDPRTVRVTAGDTAAQPFGAGSWASRSTVVGGSAVHQAALAVRERALRLAARMLEAAEEDLDLADGLVSVRGDPTICLSLAEIAKAAAPASRYLKEGEPAGLSARRRFEVSHMTYPYGAHAAVVEVDPGTGQVRVLRYLVAYEVGRAINPMLVEGQLRGGVAQGIGGALLEEFGYDEAGQPQAITFIEYRLPTAAEIPPVDVLLSQDAPSPGNPLGVMGAGEGGINAVGAAVANAVRDALGLAGGVGQLPLTPARVCALAQATGGPVTGGPVTGGPVTGGPVTGGRA